VGSAGEGRSGPAKEVKLSVLTYLSGLSCLLGSFPLNGVVSNVLSKSAVVMVRGSNLWISRQDLHGGIKGLLEVVEEDTALSDLLGLSERVSNHGVLVDPHVQVSLQSVLRLSHEEESDLFGDRVTDVSQNEAEVSINTETKIPHDWVTAHLGWWVLGRWLSAWWHASWWSVGVLLSLQVVTLVLLELMVVSEVIVEFRVDNCFDERSGMVSQLLKNLNNNIHDHWSNWWEPHEHSVNDLGAKLLQLEVAVVEAIDGWLSKLLKLWLKKIVEDVD